MAQELASLRQRNLQAKTTTELVLLLCRACRVLIRHSSFPGTIWHGKATFFTRTSSLLKTCLISCLIS